MGMNLFAQPKPENSRTILEEKRERVPTRHNTEPPHLHIKKHSLTVHDHYTVYIVKIREYSFEKEPFLRERERERERD